LVLALVTWLQFGTGGAPAGAGNTRILRIAHTNIDPAVREAFATIAREFMASRPGVEVRITDVPITLYRPWLHTQFTGGTPPDIVEAPGWLTPDDALAYLEELGPWLRRPNPENHGTPLADVAWRDTFLTGLNEQPNYYESILGHYSVPASIMTLRLVFNRDLHARILGPAGPPRTVQDLARACDRITRHGLDQDVIPLAAAGTGARILLTSIMRSCTVSLHRDLDPLAAGWNWDDEAIIAYLQGRWDWDTPAVQTALHQMREAGRHLSPGAFQMRAADASFPFMQGSAVYYVAGSNEFTTLLKQCAFPLGVVRLPVGGVSGAGTMAEGNFVPMASLAITRASPNRDLAIEFLHFLTSQEGNRRFSTLSDWLPGVRGVEPDERLADFAADTTGDPPGFSFWLMNDTRLLGLLDREIHRLIRYQGSVEDFRNAVEPSYRQLLRLTLERYSQRITLMQQRLDIALGAQDRLHALDRAPEGLRETDSLWEVQVLSTLRAARHRHALGETAAHP